MRLTWAGLAIATVLVGPLVACSGEEDASGDDGSPSFGNGTGTTGAPDSPTAAVSSPTGTAPGTPSGSILDPSAPPEVATHPEVVLVLFKDAKNWTWFCTGALVSARTVVTAAHCLQEGQFSSWEVVAPTVAGKPRIKATSLQMFDAKWSEVARPDLGVLVLETGITLPQYAELADVTGDVDSGKTVMVSTIVRTEEKPEATLKRAGTMKLSKTDNYGYTSGYGVPIYSRGGDSGAGMFLVENGQMTHKLVAVERQPDPQRKLDHLSRVTAAFIGWTASASD